MLLHANESFLKLNLAFMNSSSELIGMDELLQTFQNDFLGGNGFVSICNWCQNLFFLDLNKELFWVIKTNNALVGEDAKHGKSMSEAMAASISLNLAHAKF